MRPMQLISFFSVAICLSCGPGEAVEEKPEGAAERAPEAAPSDGAAGDASWREGLSDTEHVSLDDDATLQEIFDYIDDLSTQQKRDIAALYIQLRDDQYAVLGGSSKGGKAGKMGGKGGKMGGKAGKIGGSGAWPVPVYKQITALNNHFLSAGRELMREEQYNSWDDCAAAIDLNPPELGSPDNTVSGGIAVGERAPSSSLSDVDGAPFDWSSLSGKPAVVQFGSYTCPSFRYADDDLDALRTQYGDALSWIIIYGYEAHPTDGRQSNENIEAGINYPSPKTYEERVAMAKIAEEELNITVDTLLIDGMDDAVTKAWDGHPNRIYVLDDKGVVVAKQNRPDAEALAAVIDGLL